MLCRQDVVALYLAGWHSLVGAEAKAALAKGNVSSQEC